MQVTKRTFSGKSCVLFLSFSCFLEFTLKKLEKDTCKNFYLFVINRLYLHLLSRKAVDNTSLLLRCFDLTCDKYPLQVPLLYKVGGSG